MEDICRCCKSDVFYLYVEELNDGDSYFCMDCLHYLNHEELMLYDLLEFNQFLAIRRKEFDSTYIFSLSFLYARRKEEAKVVGDHFK